VVVLATVRGLAKLGTLTMFVGSAGGLFIWTVFRAAFCRSSWHTPAGGIKGPTRIEQATMKLKIE